MTDREKIEYLLKKGRSYLEQCTVYGAEPIDNLYRLVRLIESVLEEKAP